MAEGASASEAHAPDLKKRNQLREATRKLIEIFGEKDDDEEESPPEVPGAGPSQVTGKPPANTFDASLTLEERITRMAERMEPFRTRVPIGAPPVAE